MRFWHGSLSLLLALATLFAAGAEGASPSLVPIDGASFPAELRSIDSDWKLSFTRAGGLQSIAAANVVSWGSLPAMTSRSVALLADGGAIGGTLLSAGRERLKLDSPILGVLDLPIAQVVAVVLAAPSSAGRRDQFMRRVVEMRGETDRLLLENGDELSGILRSINHEAVELQSDAGLARIASAKIVAIVFNPALRAKFRADGLHAIAGFQDGSWFKAASIKTSGGKPSQARAQSLAVAGWSADWAWEDLVFLQPIGGRVEYLSDVEPRSYKHIPFLSLEWPYRGDRSATGALLRWDDRVYPKGLGMHSAARLTFALGPNDLRFDAEIAVDAAAGRRGSVTFRVYVDNKQRFASPIVRGGDPPAPISVDVGGGKLLSLVVDFAEQGDQLDHADWLNARLVRRAPEQSKAVLERGSRLLAGSGGESR